MRAATTALGIAIALTVCAIGFAAVERPASVTHTVTMENMRFEPETLTVARGDTIVWVNKDPVPHTATSEDGVFDSGTVLAEKSWTFTARQQGEFPYTCTFHPTMTATLQVR
jgi:plastocyanin